MDITDQQIERITDCLERIGCELNQLTNTVNGLCSCIGGINCLISNQTDSIKESLTDLTMHVAYPFQSIQADLTEIKGELDKTVPGNNGMQ